MPKRQIKICDTLHAKQRPMFIIEQYQKMFGMIVSKGKTRLHVKVRGGSDQSGRGDDSCLGEPPGQKVHQANAERHCLK